LYAEGTGIAEIICSENHQEQVRSKMSKRLTTALVFALTVNGATIVTSQSILRQSEDQSSTEKREDQVEVTRGGAKVDQSKWAQYSPRAGGSMNSKGGAEDLDSSVDHTEVGMDPTIAIFLGLSVLLVVVVAAVAASRGDVAKRNRKIHT
jgi:hypothetical protein